MDRSFFSFLLVDDEEEVHNLLKKFLEIVFGDNFMLHRTYNGADAVKKYEELTKIGQEPDLVIMDLRMPIMDGIEATRIIREKNPNVNLYALTAYAEDVEMVKRVIEAGAKGVIGKSAGYGKVVEEIGEILRK